MDGERMLDTTGGLRTKVSTTGEVVEVDLVGKDRWQQMHRLRAEGKTVSYIARTMEVDRKTVRTCLKRKHWQPYRRMPAGQKLLAPHATWLVARAPEVNFSAQVLFQELRHQRGYLGGYDTVKNAVRPLRVEASNAALTQRRFETGPGQQAQVDWGQSRVQFDSGVVPVHIFVMTLGYSRRGWFEGFTNERLESLLEAHEHAFAHFGGVCADLLYDRMRTVVLGTAEGKPRWNANFESFSRHWGFTPRLCQPYRAQTKGKVESGVKYVKRNFLPGRIFRDLEDFNAQLRLWNAEVADLRMHGTTHQRPIDRFVDEASALTGIAGHASFLDAVLRDRVVADDWMVTIDTNRYSVPWRLIGKTVQVVRIDEHWQISHQNQLVAVHRLLAGRHQLSILPEHGPGATVRNVRRRFTEPASTPRAVANPQEVEVRDLAVYEQTLETV